MKDPIQVLESEHVLTRRVLTVLERIAEHVEGGRCFPAADVARVVGYCREFVEAVHHAREDATVYPLVLALGAEENVEVIGRLLADHAATRDLLRSLALFWEPEDLLEQERAGFCAVARAYCSRMRRHMALEERHLLPHAAQLPLDDRLAIARQLDSFAEGRRDAAHWSAVVAELEENWPG